MISGYEKVLLERVVHRRVLHRKTDFLSPGDAVSNVLLTCA